MPPLNLRQQQIAGLDTEAACWRLFVDGMTSREIASELGIGRGTVSRALRRGEKRKLGDVDRMRDQTLEQLRQGHALALQGYFASIGERTRRRSKRRDGGEAGAVTETQIDTADAPAGNVAFLSEARRHAEAIARLCGLNAPLRIQPVPPDRPFEALTDAQLADELRVALRECGVDTDALPAAAG